MISNGLLLFSVCNGKGIYFRYDLILLCYEKKVRKRNFLNSDAACKVSHFFNQKFLTSLVELPLYGPSCLETWKKNLACGYAVSTINVSIFIYSLKKPIQA